MVAEVNLGEVMATVKVRLTAGDQMVTGGHHQRSRSGTWDCGRKAGHRAGEVDGRDARRRVVDSDLSALGLRVAPLTTSGMLIVCARGRRRCRWSRRQ